MPRLWLIYAKLLIISMKINVKQSFSFETQYSLKNVNINPPPLHTILVQVYMESSINAVAYPTMG